MLPFGIEAYCVLDQSLIMFPVLRDGDLLLALWSIKEALWMSSEVQFLCQNSQSLTSLAERTTNPTTRHLIESLFQRQPSLEEVTFFFDFFFSSDEISCACFICLHYP